jgi:hypothetical protein
MYKAIRTKNREKYRDSNGFKERKEYPMSSIRNPNFLLVDRPHLPPPSMFLCSVSATAHNSKLSVCGRQHYHNSNIPPITSTSLLCFSFNVFNSAQPVKFMTMDT